MGTWRGRGGWPARPRKRFAIQSRVMPLFLGGAPGGNRTPDLDVRTVLLYPLSYGGVQVESLPTGRIAILSELTAGSWARLGRGNQARSHGHTSTRPRCRPAAA